VIATEKLIALAAGDLEGAEAEAVEEHVLACGACAALFDRFLGLGEAIRGLVRGAAVQVPLTPSLVAELEAEGLVTRTYRVAQNGSVACSVGSDDRYVASYLEANLRDVTRVDLISKTPFGERRIADVTFDAERGVVSYVTSGAFLRTLPTMKHEIRLLAIEADGERELGTYLFDHTGYGSANSAPSS
jgi:hypothetical protein